MSYLIDHFLKPGAHAEAGGLGQFQGFTFDHYLEGMIVGCRRDSREPFAICVRGEDVTRVELIPPDTQWELVPNP